MVSSCRKMGKYFFASGGALLWRALVGEGYMRGCYSLALGGGSHLRCHIAFLLFIHVKVMQTHNNKPLNFDCFFGSFFCQKKNTLDMLITLN